MTENSDAEVNQTLFQPLRKDVSAGKLREIVSQRERCSRRKEANLSHSTAEQFPEPAGSSDIVLRAHEA